MKVAARSKVEWMNTRQVEAREQTGLSKFYKILSMYSHFLGKVENSKETDTEIHLPPTGSISK